MVSAWPSLMVSSKGRVVGVQVVGAPELPGLFMWTTTISRGLFGESSVRHVTLHSVNLKTRQKSLPLSAAISKVHLQTKSLEGFKLLW